ncbi:hypothetical protein ABZ897_35040 [Nonomuraea sp. NPDC046802]|uniref:hypothetical protein n=1 Tax=Nonomuraea sp. NPDC046802 TaxID=3154919 RepID=UPI00340B0621
MSEKLVRTSYVDPTVNPSEPRQGDTGLHESRQDQEGYVGPLHRMHGSLLHGWGVAAGLRVSAVIGQAGLRISPGAALDVRGRLLPLSVGGQAKLDDDTLVPVTETGLALPTTGLSGEHRVTIGWAETFDFTGVGSGVFNTETTPALRLRADAVPDDGEEIVLALVDLGPGGAVLKAAVDQRRTTGLSAGRIQLTGSADTTDAAPGAPVAVADGRQAELRALRDGGVALEASRFVVSGPAGGPALWVDPAAGRVGVNTAPGATLDVDGTTVLRGGAFLRGPVGVGRPGPLALVHAVAQGGFEAEDGQGKLSASGIPLLAEARTDGQTAIGALNSSGRPAFALSIDHDQGTPGARGLPAFWDKYDGAWHMAFSIKNGNLAVGHKNPDARLHVVGAGGGNTALRVETPSGVGLHTFSEGSGIPLVIGSRKTAALISGNVDIRGTLTKSDLRFKIDHPLDPAGRYLSHGAVESDEMKNVYDGEVVLDEHGAAEVTLPGWFEALNERFRYQLTPIGAPAPNLHIAKELSGNVFAIAGGPPGAKVCWQVTGVRHDPYALASPLVVESAKEGDEHGRYRHPQAHGLTADLELSLTPGD